MELICNTVSFKINRYAANSNVTFCGCATIGSPASIFPPAGTPLSCLATGLATTLTKRAQVFQKEIAGYRVTCNTDSNNNPYQDCLNAQAAVCNPAYIAKNGQSDCKNAVDDITRKLSSLWNAVRINCGQWSFDGVIGSLTSSKCTNANNALKDKAYYILPDGSKSFIDAPFIDSLNTGLWGNTDVKA